jgi:hypothetical protein
MGVSASFALHFKPKRLAWRNIDEILIFWCCVEFHSFSRDGFASNSDDETHAPCRHGHADTIIISDAYLLFSGDYDRFGGATAFSLIRDDAINPAFGDRSKAVT